MELELGLALPGSNPVDVTSGRRRHGGLDDLNGVPFAAGRVLPGKMKKRGFDEAFDGDIISPTAALPLFVWGGGGGEKNNNLDSGLSPEDDHNNGGAAREASLVGWPPVKSPWRNAGGTRHVKVKMEGVAIGRKVDLSLHRSYATLVGAVDRLFAGNLHEVLQLEWQYRPAAAASPPAASRPARTFTYQVGNGDWMLLGDAPWEVFVRSVKRIKIVGGTME